MMLEFVPVAAPVEPEEVLKKLQSQFQKAVNLSQMVSSRDLDWVTTAEELMESLAKRSAFLGCTGAECCAGVVSGVDGVLETLGVDI
jgi:hypothetical protein